MLKILNKKLIRSASRGLFKNPLFYFGLFSVVLFSGICLSCDSSANIGNLNDGHIALSNSFFDNTANLSGSLFSSQASAIPLETPDLKIMQSNTICGVATPCVVSGKVLGDVFGSSNQKNKEVIEYAVQPGDTIQSILYSYNISLNTLLWANDLTSSSVIKAGQTLLILPVDGVLHIVKSGDTISGIAKTYLAKSDDIISYNDLSNQDDIYIGDILIVPGGVMPKKSAPVINNQVPLANNFFIYPTEGIIWQGLHYYHAVDIANNCGTPIRAAAAGIVQRAVGNGLYNQGMGNHVTILHSNGTTTYYGHLMTLFVKAGDKVYTGQNIGLMGGKPGMAGAGRSTGCHVHFQVTGATNWLTLLPVKTTLKYK